MRRSIAALVVAATAALPAAAGADGLPVVGVDAGSTGTTTAADRFVTLPARGGTVVARVRRDDGEVVRTRFVRGTYTVPAVALDGSAGGVSADGRRLVLIRPRVGFPRAVTPVLVLDAARLRPRAHVRLRGDFSFDAISPDGATMFLVHYLSRRDPTRYEVRAFDLRRLRLRPGAIVDRREPDEAMRGLPLTRTTSPDGRWAYTLYDGAGAHPFVHALDTAGGGAHCIDLDFLTDHPRLYELRLALAGGALAVRDGSNRVARIDTTTFRVARAEPTRAAATPADGTPWPLPVALAAGLVLVAGIATRAVRRAARRGAPGGAGSPPATARRRRRARWPARAPRA
jgi:hypothetical protein